MSGVSLFDVLYRTGAFITTESIPASTVNTGRVCAFIHIFTFIYPCVQAKSAKQNIFLTTCHRKRWSRVAEVSASQNATQFNINAAEAVHCYCNSCNPKKTRAMR